jgi:hypothetical protein
VLTTPPVGYLVDEPSGADALIDKRRGEPAFDAAIAALQDLQTTGGDDAFNTWQQTAAPPS